MADDLTDLFVDALQNMRMPSYAQDRHTRSPIVFEKNTLSKKDVEPGVDPKSVIASYDEGSYFDPKYLARYFANVKLPMGVISVDPRRAAANIQTEGAPQSLDALIRHEAVHHLQSTANNGTDIKDPTEKDVPSLGPIKKLAKDNGFQEDAGNLDTELPAYVAHQPWRIPGLTGELRNQFINEYSDYLSKYDPVAGKTYKLMAPEMTATPRDTGVSAITMSTPVKATIANLDETQQ